MKPHAQTELRQTNRTLFEPVYMRTHFTTRYIVQECSVIPDR